MAVGPITSPIRLGSWVFTMVEPTREHVVEYNRWYEHDHFYAACLAGPWLFAGGRFVATRRLKELRSPMTSDMTPDNTVGSYLAVYWVLDGHHEEWSRWAADQTNWLHEHGRMSEHRAHVHSHLYRHGWSVRREPRGCAIELALDHASRGLVVVAGDVVDGCTHTDVEGWFREQYLTRAMAEPWGPDVVASATILPPPDSSPPSMLGAQPGPRRFLQLHFLDHDPADGWHDGYARLGAAVDSSGVATHVWTAPFVPTNFGTDDYTDELW